MKENYITFTLNIIYVCIQTKVSLNKKKEIKQLTYLPLITYSIDYTNLWLMLFFNFMNHQSCIFMVRIVERFH